MASTPFDDNDPAIEERIRTRAYHLWESEGQPHGRDADYWERASELVHMEQAGNTGQIAPGDATEVIDDAALQENLGEFPDRFADQGEKSTTPSAKATSRLRHKPEHAADDLPPPDEDEAPPPAADATAKREKPAEAPKSPKAAEASGAEKPGKSAKSGAAADAKPAAPPPKKASAPKSSR